MDRGLNNFNLHQKGQEIFYYQAITSQKCYPFFITIALPINNQDELLKNLRNYIRNEIGYQFYFYGIKNYSKNHHIHALCNFLKKKSYQKSISNDDFISIKSYWKSISGENLQIEDIRNFEATAKYIFLSGRNCSFDNKWEMILWGNNLLDKVETKLTNNSAP